MGSQPCHSGHKASDHTAPRRGPQFLRGISDMHQHHRSGQPAQPVDPELVWAEPTELELVWAEPTELQPVWAELIGLGLVWEEMIAAVIRMNETVAVESRMAELVSPTQRDLEPESGRSALTELIETGPSDKLPDLLDQRLIELADSYVTGQMN